MASLVGRKEIEINIKDLINGYIPVYDQTTGLWTTISKQDILNSATASIALTAISASYAPAAPNLISSSGQINILGDITASNVLVQGNLAVLGSSSIQYITSSQVNIGSNKIVLNTTIPAVRYGGMAVVDFDTSQATGSLLWDGVTNHWIYENVSGSAYNSAIIIAGPKNTGSLGQEVGLTVNRIPVASGEDHIKDSQIVDDGNFITIGGLLVTVTNDLTVGSTLLAPDITGSLFGTATSASFATNAISASYAVSASYVDISNIQNQNITGSFSGSFFGILTGSSFGTSSWAQFALNADTSSYAFNALYVDFANVGNKPTLLSSSVQVDYNQIQNKPTIIPTASYVDFANVANKPALVSSSQQVSTGSYTGSFAGIFSGQIDATSATASYVEFANIANKPALVSSSQQINTGSFSGSITTASYVIYAENSTSASYVLPSGLPFGTVSSSAQVDYSFIQNKPTTIPTASHVDFLDIGGKPTLVSSSQQINTGSFTGSFNGIFSGSLDATSITASYVDFSNIANKPTLVSSSQQINTGSFTGSFNGIFSGDGSGLTNIPVSLQTDNYVFVGNGTITNFILSQSYASSSVSVFVAGLSYANDIDYTLNATVLSFTSAPPSGSNILVKALVNTSNAVGSFSGSFIGTASFANTSSYALNGLSGGAANYIPVWISSTAQSSSAIYQTINGIGINTINPSHPLDVNGIIRTTNIYINGLTYAWPTSHGNSGYILANDGAGSLTWADAASIAPQNNTADATTTLLKAAMFGGF